jgi:hypothetical protein
VKTLSAMVGPVMIAGLSLLLSGCIGVTQTRAVEPVGTAALKPTQEDKEAGLVGLASGFSVKDYQVIVVRPFKVTEPELKDADDQKLAVEMPAFFQASLVRRLRESGVFANVINGSEMEYPPESAKALVLEGAITRLAPGSPELRYFAGFGAGRTTAQTEMRFVDRQSGSIVLVTADRREVVATGAAKTPAGRLREAFDDIARDLGKFLVRLSRGEAPRKE